MSHDRIELTLSSKAQILLLVSFMERNENLRRSEEIENDNEVKMQWNELVINLNAIGIKRNLEEWKEIWQSLVVTTNNKNIDAIDVRIYNMFQPKAANASALKKRAEDLYNVVVKKRAVADVAEEDKIDMHNRLMSHIVGCLNANTRVMENGFNRLSENTRKMAKAAKRNLRR